ncbi:MAG: acyltransferase family protein [Desulfitobacteriaceae bacterium]
MSTLISSKVERVEWVDILKGLGILTVVWGHSGSRNGFIVFWFHMPLFFLLSGYLYQFKPEQTWLVYVWRKIRHLLIPYLFYLSLLTLIMSGINIWRGQRVGQLLSENWKALLLGGSLLEGIYATFWFITCLFFVQILFDYLCRRVNSVFFKALILIGCYLIAYWESRYFEGVFVPWNMDVSLFAIVFYGIGHFIKQSKVLEKANRRNIIIGVSLVIVLSFVYMYSNRLLDYGLDMKHRQYYYFGTNLLVPLTITLLLINLSMIFTRWSLINNVFTRLGKAAMTIMYLHISAVNLVRQFISITSVRFVIIGILLPYLFYKGIQVFSYGRFLALGEKNNDTIKLFKVVKTHKL